MARQPAPSYQPRNIVTAAGPACDAERRRRCSESRGGVRHPPARQLIPPSARRRLTRRPSPARAPARLHPPNQEVNRRRKCL
ncbi:hypothetical protein PAL_GLEAN10021162 [Pteropus alecto]|uniref:Uncharacterized protein n=1 Tax=Pteropus alecto TaxID=9402 RepID=L5KT85_PTEAL|nr:hypothetical protein PAL_GLEAN10021162 [Pteropus alecto]